MTDDKCSSNAKCAAQFADGQTGKLHVCVLAPHGAESWHASSDGVMIWPDDMTTPPAPRTSEAPVKPSAWLRLLSAAKTHLDYRTTTSDAELEDAAIAFVEDLGLREKRTQEASTIEPEPEEIMVHGSSIARIELAGANISAGDSVMVVEGEHAGRYGKVLSWRLCEDGRGYQVHLEQRMIRFHKKAPPEQRMDYPKLAGQHSDLKSKHRKCVDRIGVLNQALARAIQHIDDYKADTGGGSLVEELDAIADTPWEEEHGQPISNLGLAGMLAAVLSAWRKEANQGDGIDEEHASLFATAEGYMQRYWPSLLDAPKVAPREVDQRSYNPRIDVGSRVCLAKVAGTVARRSENDPTAWRVTWPSGTQTSHPAGDLMIASNEPRSAKAEGK